jgi:hypothetical protein
VGVGVGLHIIIETILADTCTPHCVLWHLIEEFLGELNRFTPAAGGGGIRG